MKFPVDVYSEPESLTGVELDRAVARRCSVGDIPTRSAQAFGDRIALVDDGGELSYNDLEKQSNRLAHGLRALGIEQREPIAILSPNCNEYLVSYFGIAKMGGAATLVNLLGGDDHAPYSLSSTGCRVVICHDFLLPFVQMIAPMLPEVEHIIAIKSGMLGEIPQVDGVTTHGWDEVLGELAESMASDPEVPPYVAVADRQIVQCMFSSGSTAEPKGILTSHLSVLMASVSNAAMIGLPRGTEPSVHTVVLPLFHSVALNVLSLGVLTVGGRLHLLRGFDPEELCRTLAESGSTHFVGLPVMLEAILDYSRENDEPFPKLQGLYYGMAPMSDELYRGLGERFPHIEVLLASGMTEALPATIMQPPGMPEEKRSSWGIGGSHMESRVLGEDLDEYAVGESGELMYRGPSVMERYLIDDDAVFAGGWLHSGDLGYFDDDGYFWFTDRSKDLIKSGGENVSSIDVEQAVLGHEEVAEAAIVGVPDVRWGEKVVAVVVLKSGIPTEEAAEEISVSIIDFAAERLNSSHRPRDVRFYKELPRTGSGKVRKNVIREEVAAAG